MQAQTFNPNNRAESFPAPGYQNPAQPEMDSSPYSGAIHTPPNNGNYCGNKASLRSARLRFRNGNDAYTKWSRLTGDQRRAIAISRAVA